jgi:TonB-linked SusC/RagA family outer membrane protein
MFKWAFFFLFALCMKVSANGYAQNNKISLEVRNMEFRKLLSLLQKKGKIHLLYSNELLPAGREITLSVKEEGVLDVLQKVLINTGLRFKVLSDELVVIVPEGTEVKSASLKGRVVDENGKGLAGVSVQVEGSKGGVTTDQNGEFQLIVPENAKLIFTYVGYIRQTIPVDNRDHIDIVLKLDPTAASLNDVIVVGYGTQKRSDVTGSVSSVLQSRLTEIPVTNVLNAVEGSVAGFTVTQTSFTPGATATLQVRGLNSITASTTPLIVLDGVPFPGSTNDINPNDIESIEILKDASATAIYGTRGSSGVLLITTKKGRMGKAVIRYSGYAGPEYIARDFRPMNGAQYVQKNLDYHQQTGITPAQPVFDSVINTAEVPNFRAGKQVDWIKEVTRPAYMEAHNINFSGGTNDVRYYINGEYSKDNGVLKGYQYRRISLRSNLDANLAPWLSIGTSLFYANNNYDGGHVNLTLAGQMSPYGQEYNPDGTYDVYPMLTQLLYMNPLLGLYQPTINRSNNLTGTGWLEFKPLQIPGLKYRMNASYSYIPGRYDYYTGRNMGDQIGHAYAQNTETQNWIVENIVSYTKDIHKHHFDLTALYSAQHNNFFVNSLSANTFINDQLGFNNVNAGQIQTVNNTDALNNNARPSQYALLSQMGRLNYSYAGKYLITLTARRDGYSGFGALTSKYGVFPTVAVAWNMAKEDFFKTITAVNSLKLRVSYGTTGNSAIQPYQTLSTLGTTQYVYNNTTATGVAVSNILGTNPVLGSLGNAGLKWESTTGTNIGIDFSILNRIDGTIEGYITKTSDLLLSRNLPIISGYQSILDNIGKLENRGMDISIHSINIRTANFTWETNLIYSFYHNKITQLYGDGKDDIGNGWFIGKSLGAIYTYKLLGVWQTGEDPSGSNPGAKPGDLKFADLDKSGSITAADREVVGYTVPKWTGGLINTFSYKDFSLRVFITTNQGAMKNDPILNPADQAGAINLPASVGYWTATNKSSDRSSLSYTNPLGYPYPKSASYTRIQDITLNYRVPARIVNSWGLGSLSLYLSGRNIHTFTNWVGWDPESNYNGGTSVNYNNYPIVATYVFGINLSLK